MSAGRAARGGVRRAVAVYPIVDLAQAGDGAERAIAAVLRGGATMVQVRDKRGLGDEVVRLCRRVRAWLDEAGALLVINDRVDVAVGVGADGVHVGQHDAAPAAVRAAALRAGRPGLIVGVSVTTPEQARGAVADGADYVSVSPVFGTSTKTDLDPPAGLDGVAAIRGALPDVAVVAIGGITPARVAEVVGAGADGVAFISALGSDPEAGVRAMAAAVRLARRESGR